MFIQGPDPHGCLPGLSQGPKNLVEDLTVKIHTKTIPPPFTPIEVVIVIESAWEMAAIIMALDYTRRTRAANTAEQDLLLSELISAFTRI